MEMVMESFSLLKDRSKLNVKPDRIKIVNVNQPATLRAFFKSQNMKEANFEKLALLNGRYLKDTLEKNVMIKVIAYGR